MTAYLCGRMKRLPSRSQSLPLVVGNDMWRLLKWRRSNKGPHESRSFSLERATGSYCVETGHISSGYIRRNVDSGFTRARRECDGRDVHGCHVTGVIITPQVKMDQTRF